jgi:hypothetical protein
MIQILVTDQSNSFLGKKLIANGTESLSYFDIDNMIKQSYSNKGAHKEANNLIRKLNFNWQIFFHGNTHITNMFYMLNYLHNHSLQFDNLENAGQLMNLQTKSFRQYYIEKAEKFDDRIKENLVSEEPDDLRFPRLNNYWNISLD